MFGAIRRNLTVELFTHTQEVLCSTLSRDINYSNSDFVCAFFLRANAVITSPSGDENSLRRTTCLLSFDTTRTA
jgi:hypothetical protein